MDNGSPLSTPPPPYILIIEGRLWKITPITIIFRAFPSNYVRSVNSLLH